MPPPQDDEPLYRSQLDRRLLARLLALVQPHRRILVASVLLLIALTAAELSFPLLMKKGIDTYISGHDVHGLLRLSGAYLALLILVFVLRYAQTVTTQGLGQRIMYDLRRTMYRHVQALSIRYFDRNPVGRIMTRLAGDVEVLNELFTSGLVSIFGDILVLAGIVTIMLLLDARLALACFVILPPLFVATIIFRARVRDAYTTIRLKVSAMNAFLQEHLTGISVIQLFRGEASSAGQFDGLNCEHRDAFLRSVRAYAIYFPVVELLEVGAVALILGYGGRRVIDEGLSVGVLIAFLQYSERFFRPIRDLSERYNTLQGAMASSERIFELLDTRSEVRQHASPRVAPAGSSGIVFDRVSFGYQSDTPVLRDLSFRVAAGESIALVGHTGAGKTTIASLAVRFHDVDQGAILVGGIDVREWDLRALRRRIAIVPQDVYLFSGSALRNIGLRDPSMPEAKILSAIRTVEANDFLQKLPHGLETELRERANLLSTGQRQLLSFARALAHDPGILILDEATSSVDSQTEIRIRSALRTLTSGRTSLIIAHRLSTIRHVDRILVLHKGKLVEEGTHQELLAHGGIYSRLYDLEFRQQEGEEPKVADGVGGAQETRTAGGHGSQE